MPPGGIWGRPPDGGRGGVCSRRGLVQRDAPPIFFSVLPEKKTGRARSKRKGRLARSGAVALRARRGSAYRCLLRFGLAFGHAILFCEVGTAVPWRIVRRSTGCKNAFDLFLFPRVPLRYALPWRSWWLVPNKTEGLPRPRRGRCPHRPVAVASSRDSQRQRKEKLLNAITTPTRSAPYAAGRQYRSRRRE